MITRDDMLGHRRPFTSRANVLLMVTDWSTMLLLLVAPLFMAGRHPVGRLVFVALICATVVSWAWHRYVAGNRQYRATGMEMLMLAAAVMVVLQMVPLPHAWLARLSPAIADRLTLWTGSTASNLQLGEWSCISLHPQATRIGLAMYVAYALLFVVVAQRLRSMGEIERIVRWVAGAAIVMAALGLLQFLCGNGKFLWVYAHPTRDTIGVVRGAFANQNHFAHFLALGIGPLLWWLVQRPPADRRATIHRGHRETHFARLARTARTAGWSRLLLSFSVGLLLLAGLLTFSRAGLCAMLLAVTISVVLLFHCGLAGRLSWRYLALLGGFLPMALAIYGYQPLTTRLATLVGATSLADLSAGRDLVWSAVGKAVAESPVLGSGIGTHPDVYPMFLSEYSASEFTHAESGYLQVLEELGVVGFCLLLVAIGTIANWCRVAVVRAGSRHDRLLAGVVSVSLLVSALHAAVDFVWYIPACMSTTVILAACARRLSQIADERYLELGPIELPRPMWVAVSWTMSLTSLVVLIMCLGPARSARYWDQFARMATGVNSQTYQEMMVSCAETEVDVDQLIDQLHRAVDCHPRDARAQCRLAGLYLQKFELAQKHAQNNLPLSQIRDAALQSHFASLQAQDRWLARAVPENRFLLDRALRHARSAVRLCPLQGEAYVYLAQLGFLSGDGARAKYAYLNQALRVRPHDGNVLLAVGCELALAGDVQQATVYWKRVFDRAPVYRQQIVQLFASRVPAEKFLEAFQPDSAAAECLFAHYRKMGIVPSMQVAGQYYLARLARESKDNHTPLAAEQWYSAFVVQESLARDAAAIECLQQAVALAPDHFAYRQKLARQLLRRQRYDEARDQLQWCMRRKPHDTSLQRDLQVATRGSLSDRLR